MYHTIVGRVRQPITHQDFTLSERHVWKTPVMSHPNLKDKVGCVSYVRQERTTHIITECLKDKFHKYHKCAYYIAEVLQNK
jgi:hypothetical protein